MKLIEDILAICLWIPIWITIEGCKKWSKWLNEDNPFGAFLGTLLVILTFMLIVLLIMGYR